MNTPILRLLTAFLVMLLLTILPLPALLAPVRPAFVFLLIFYLYVYLPQKIPVVAVLAAGLVLDSLLSTVLGEHAFALCLAGWIIQGKIQRFPLYATLQQMVLAGFSCLVYETILWLINAFLGYPVSYMQVIGVSVFSALLWPWLRLAAEEWLRIPVSSTH